MAKKNIKDWPPGERFREPADLGRDFDNRRFREVVHIIVEKALAIYDSKNTRYVQTWAEYGAAGIFIHIAKKFKLLYYLFWLGKKPEDIGEHPLETILDLLVYGFMLYIVVCKALGKPLPKLAVDVPKSKSRYSTRKK